MQADYPSQYGQLQFEGIQVLSSKTPTNSSQKEQLNYSINWKLNRDYTYRITLDLICSITQITQCQQQSEHLTSNDQHYEEENIPKASDLFLELQRFSFYLVDRTKRMIDRMNITLKSEMNHSQEVCTKDINRFFEDLSRELEFGLDFYLSVTANYNWNGINIGQIAKNTKYLIINDVYSYFPLSNFQFPQLKDLVITSSKTDLQYMNINSTLMQDLERDFENFICFQLLKQLESIEINGNQYPSLIKIVISNLLNAPQISLKRLDLQLTLDPRQFHLILSLSHLHFLLNKLELSLNYILDFALLQLNQLPQQEILFSSLEQYNLEDNNTHCLTAFPYLFTKILQSFSNKRVHLTFKNLKSNQQLELFDRIRQHSETLLKSDNSLYLQSQKNNKMSVMDYSSEITGCVYVKQHNLPQISQINKISQIMECNLDSQKNCQQHDAIVSEQNNSFKISQPILSLLAKTFSFKYKDDKLLNQLEICEEKKKTITNERKNSDKLNEDHQKSNEPLAKQNHLLQNKQENNQKNIILASTFPIQPFSIFKCKQQEQNIQKLQSKNIESKLTQQAFLAKKEPQEDIFSNYFLSFKQTEITSIELVFENTVFGNNYKELFTFISKCTHLKRLSLLNFCLQDDFDIQNNNNNNNNNNSNINNNNNSNSNNNNNNNGDNGQRNKLDTQQALQMYSSVFRAQPKKAIEKVIPDFLQSLRNSSLVSFRFSTNLSFSYSQVIRLLQTQEEIVHFSLRDFSTYQQKSIGEIAGQQSRGQVMKQVKSKEKQLVDSILSTLDENERLISFYFKNTDTDCIQSKREFQQIIGKYLHSKKVLMYQIYASKSLLHTDIIKRKEIFNYLITKYFIQTNNMQSDLNKIFSSIDI